MSRRFRALGKFLLVILLTYGLVAAMLFALQRSMIYPGTSRDMRDWDDPLPGYETVTFETPDGLGLRAFFRAPGEGGKTLIFFHGNADSARNSAAWVDPALGAADGALFVSYRGYAGNPGGPSEDGLYADGEGALAFVRDRGIDDNDIVLAGISLGTGVASHLATQGEFAGLLLISPFTSLPDAAASHFPWLPTHLLVRDRFATIDRIADASGPVLIIHGQSDGIVSPSHSDKLAARRPDARLEKIRGAGHNDIGAYAQPIIAEWLDGLD